MSFCLNDSKIKRKVKFKGFIVNRKEETRISIEPSFVVAVPTPRSVRIRKFTFTITDINTLLQLMKGDHLKSKNTCFITAKKAIIKTKEKEKFIGDGDIIVNSNKFKLKIIPKAINVCYIKPQHLYTTYDFYFI